METVHMLAFCETERQFRKKNKQLTKNGKCRYLQLNNNERRIAFHTSTVHNIMCYVVYVCFGSTNVSTFNLFASTIESKIQFMVMFLNFFAIHSEVYQMIKKKLCGISMNEKQLIR